MMELVNLKSKISNIIGMGNINIEKHAVSWYVAKMVEDTVQSMIPPHTVLIEGSYAFYAVHSIATIGSKAEASGTFSGWTDSLIANVRKDFDHLYVNYQKEFTIVPISFWGPMWPDGAPSGWPSLP
jgi:hypothetical protein